MSQCHDVHFESRPLVGGGGIGYLLIQYMNLPQFNQAATVLWLMIIVVLVMDFISGFIRSRLV